MTRNLVGNDPSLYEQLLSDSTREDLHLIPLERQTGTSGEVMALAALRRGYDPESIADALFRTGGEMVRNESDYWATRGKDFSSFLDHSDSQIREVGTIITGWARSAESEARKRERHEEVFGR
jgi:hypothetical protein